MWPKFWRTISLLIFMHLIYQRSYLYGRSYILKWWAHVPHPHLFACFSDRGYGGPRIHLRGEGLTTEEREVPGSIWGERGWPQRKGRSQDASEGSGDSHRGKRGSRIHLRGVGLTTKEKEVPGSIWGERGWPQRKRRSQDLSEGSGDSHRGKGGPRIHLREEGPTKEEKEVPESIWGVRGQPQRTHRSQVPSEEWEADHWWQERCYNVSTTAGITQAFRGLGQNHQSISWV